MKIKDGLILREVAGQYVVVPVGKRVREISQIHYMTKDAAMLWESVYGQEFEVEDLVAIIKKHFPHIDNERAKREADNFIEGAKARYLLENDKCNMESIRFRYKKNLK